MMPDLIGDSGLAIRHKGGMSNDKTADLQPTFAQDGQVAVSHILTTCKSHSVGVSSTTKGGPSRLS